MMTVILMMVFGVMLHLNTGMTYKYAPLVVISLLTFCIQIGPESFPNLISSEIFPNHARSSCKGILRAVSSVFSFLVLTAFPTLTRTIGLDMTFIFLAFLLLLTLLPTYLYLPEAKDVDLSCISKFYEPQRTKFYKESEKEEGKKRVTMICNSFGWSGTCLCKDSSTLLAEGLVCVKGCGERLVCVFSDKIVLGTVVTPSILHRNMKILNFCDIDLDHGQLNTIIISHGVYSYCLEFSSTKEKSPWTHLLKDQHCI